MKNIFIFIAFYCYICHHTLSNNNIVSQVSYVSNRANIYLSMKKWEEAEKDASKAIEMDPKNAKVIFFNDLEKVK